MSVVNTIPKPEVEVHPDDMAAAQRGAQLLDEHVPGWPLRVERALNMWSPQFCVAGQVCGARNSEEYGQFVEPLIGGLWQQEFYGFMPAFRSGDRTTERSLAAAWASIINERRISLRH